MVERDYMRSDYDGGSFRGPLSLIPWLIGGSVAFFFVQVATGLQSRALDSLMLFPFDVLERGFVWQLVTTGFLHGDLWHLVFNMLFLWWFGRMVEERYGWKKFAWLYGGGLVFASAVYVITQGLRGDPTPAIGASGAVMGVMVIAAIFYPNMKILLFLIIPVPLWLMVAFYVGIDLMRTLQNTGGGVATASHLGGAAFGVIFWFIERQGGLRAIQNVKKRTVEMFTPSEEEIEQKIDQLLAKISEEGMASLSEKEKSFLKKYSEKMK